jgi:hypothetical protein
MSDNYCKQIDDGFPGGAASWQDRRSAPLIEEITYGSDRGSRSLFHQPVTGVRDDNLGDVAGC